MFIKNFLNYFLIFDKLLKDLFILQYIINLCCKMFVNGERKKIFITRIQTCLYYISTLIAFILYYMCACSQVLLNISLIIKRSL